MPILSKNVLKYFGINSLAKGALYPSQSTRNLTLIRVGIGPAFTGDAALYLKNTACQNIILLGSCALIKEEGSLKTGSLLLADKAYNMESFSRMLSCKNLESPLFNADKKLIENLFLAGTPHIIKRVTCVTTGSLKLETEFRDLFLHNNIEAVDMECSALFSAATAIKRKSAALFYATDVIGEKSFYTPFGDHEKTAVADSIRKAAGILSEFAEQT